MTDIVILDGARTAIGTFGGSLAATAPIDLGATAAKAAMERSGVEGGQGARVDDLEVSKRKLLQLVLRLATPLGTAAGVGPLGGDLEVGR